MRLLDTDILIDIQRGHQPAVAISKPFDALNQKIEDGPAVNLRDPVRVWRLAGHAPPIHHGGTQGVRPRGLHGDWDRLGPEQLRPQQPSDGAGIVNRQAVWVEAGRAAVDGGA